MFGKRYFTGNQWARKQRFNENESLNLPWLVAVAAAVAATFDPDNAIGGTSVVDDPWDEVDTAVAVDANEVDDPFAIPYIDPDVFDSECADACTSDDAPFVNTCAFAVAVACALVDESVDGFLDHGQPNIGVITII